MKTDKKPLRQNDQVLRGLALSLVLINHYLNMNVAGNFSGFANLWVAVFFILSGYGLFFSLKHRRVAGFNRQQLGIFYYHRLIRIFPLLWIAWLIELSVRGNNVSFWVPTGLHGSDHYWFIPALLQCYLIAPLLYEAIKKRPIILFITMVAGLTGIYLALESGLFPPLIERLFKFINADWRGVYFLYLPLFAIGMGLGRRRDKSGLAERFSSWLYMFLFWGLVLTIIIMMAYLKYLSTSGQAWAAPLFNLLPLLPVVLLCGYALDFPIQNRPLAFLGRISYSVYLFHLSYYHLISDRGDFAKNSLTELAIYIIFFPVFLYLCNYFEKLVKRFSDRLKTMVPSGQSRQVPDIPVL